MKQFEIIYHWLPQHIGGALTKNSNGSYLVIINDSLDAEHQRSAIGHELAHLYLNHLESSEPEEQKEIQAEMYSDKYYQLWKEGKLA